MYNVKDELQKLITAKENIKKECQEISNKLKEHEKNTRIAELTGKVVSTIGGIMALSALISAPFTFGSTLPVFAVGAGIFSTGGTVSFGTKVTKVKLINNLCEDANKLLKADMIATQQFNEKLETLNNDTKRKDPMASCFFEMGTKQAFNVAKISFKTGLAAADVAKIVLETFLNSSLNILTSIFNIHEIVKNSIDIHKGTVSPQAENLDKMIAQLEIEIENLKESYKYVLE
jgi:hypothetical protein